MDEPHQPRKALPPAHPDQPRPPDQQVAGDVTPDQEFAATVSCGAAAASTGAAASTAALELPGGRYHVVREIARGGMGMVLRAIDTNLQRSLAIKVILEVLLRLR